MLTAKQVQGYRNNLVGAVRADKTGAEVVIDLTTARKIIDILDEHMTMLETDHYLDNLTAKK